MARSVREPFDLERGPVFRVATYRHGSDAAGVGEPLVFRLESEACSHTILLFAHHIAVDLWSVLILIDELAEIYGELANGRNPASVSAIASYAAFAAWQQRYLDAPSSNEDWDYWRSRLTGELPILALPADRLRPPAPDYRGASVPMRLTRDEAERLKILAGQQRVTLFTLLLAAYKVLLHRYTHQIDLIVGVPTSGRSQAGFSRVVGNFVNPVPLRSHPSGNKPFSAYLEEVHGAVLGALEHQDYPFSLMVERLHVQRNADHWPVYQTLFVLQQAQAGIPSELAQLALGEDSKRSAWGHSPARAGDPAAGRELRP